MENSLFRDTPDGIGSVYGGGSSYFTDNEHLNMPKPSDWIRERTAEHLKRLPDQTNVCVLAAVVDFLDDKFKEE